MGKYRFKLFSLLEEYGTLFGKSFWTTFNKKKRA
jgi:hypothetical protein